MVRMSMARLGSDNHTLPHHLHKGPVLRVTAKIGRPCLNRVKSGPADAERGLPLYPRTRTGGGGRFSQCGDVLPAAIPMVLHFRPGVPEKPSRMERGSRTTAQAARVTARWTAGFWLLVYVRETRASQCCLRGFDGPLNPVPANGSASRKRLFR
jgi:hypothetical protein